MIDGKDAADLAAAALAYRNILSGLEIKVSSEGFDGCEQAQLLVKWWRDGNPDADLMRKWTAEIRAAISDLADGKLPKLS